MCKGTKAWKDGGTSRGQSTHVLRTKAIQCHWRLVAKVGKYKKMISERKEGELGLGRVLEVLLQSLKFIGQPYRVTEGFQSGICVPKSSLVVMD